MDGESDMKIDVMHALEDFLDAYDNRAEMVVTEAVANAIDVGAGRIDVDLKADLDDTRTVSFYNDGPPMSGKQFEDYHVIARSSKSKGAGIGFAGIGAKVYLAAWNKASIRTETGDGERALGSDMYVRGRTLKYKMVEPALKKSGTLYRVTLKPDDYNYLEECAEGLISDIFDPAIAAGLAITLDGRRVMPWSPKPEFDKSFVATAKGRKFPVKLSVTEDEIPFRKTIVQYHVSGKVISTKKPDWLPEVRPEYSGRIHAYVDAGAISGALNLTKTGFKPSAGPALRAVESRIYSVLSDAGFIGEDESKKFERTRLTRFFEDLFRKPEYAFLNPEARGGPGPGGGGSGGGGPGGGGGSAPERTRSGDVSGRNRRGGSLQMGFVHRPKDPREGWLDPATNKVIVNLDHPLYVKYERNRPARNQRVATVLTSVLIKNAVARKPMDAVEALTLHNDLLTMSRNEVW